MINEKEQENIIKKNIENKIENNENENIIIQKEEYKIERLFEVEDKTELFYSIMIIGDNQVGKSWIFLNSLHRITFYMFRFRASIN